MFGALWVKIFCSIGSKGSYHCPFELLLLFAMSRGLNLKHFYNGVVQVQDHFRYGFVEIDM